MDIPQLNYIFEFEVNFTLNIGFNIHLVRNRQIISLRYVRRSN